MADASAPAGGYIPGLDGLRALSVLAVVAGHAGIPRAPASLGVTVFFFISGFLITGLLLREAAARCGGFSITNFYVRRYLRLTPELVLYVAVAAIGSALLFEPHGLLDLSAALFYFTNYVDIFSPADPQSPFRLGHLWSLAVEEHFYLTWPLLLSLCIGHAQRVVALCGTLVLLPILIRTVGLGAGLPLSYARLASEARVDSIAFGCLLATGLHYRRDLVQAWARRGHLIGLVGALLVALFTFGALIGLRGEPHEILVYTGQGVGLLMVFAYLYASASGAWLLKLLEWRPLRFIGQVSYGFYLWHFLILYALAIAFGRARPEELPLELQLLCTVLGAMLGTLMGWISLKVALPPVRRLRQRFGAHLLVQRD
ncbi:acyltransferase family protein [Sphingomonas sp. 3-13AW]|uniref:acyltransferase family protein n=1 Tax=Sphingomonas sp. 3-13AW TaxID=3050450 RepID=UPI003BB4E594